MRKAAVPLVLAASIIGLSATAAQAPGGSRLRDDLPADGLIASSVVRVRDQAALDAHYYLADESLLGLDGRAEAVFARYRAGRGRRSTSLCPDLVEEQHARGRRGIMEGGACYGCVFAGGATDNLWTMAKLLRPTRAGMAMLRVPLSSVLLGWVVLKCCVLTLVELTRDLLRLIADPLAERWPGFRWLLLKIGLSIWTRQLFTLAASSDLYRGAPAVFVNYLEYDVFAHAFGPEHPYALRALRRVDRSIRQLVRILRRLPEMGYDLYILPQIRPASRRFRTGIDPQQKFVMLQSCHSTP